MLTRSQRTEEIALMQPEMTPDVELDVPEEEDPNARKRVGRFRRFVARQLRRGARAIERRRASRAASGRSGR